MSNIPRKNILLPACLIIAWLAMFWSNVYLTWPIWYPSSIYPWVPISQQLTEIPHEIDLGIMITLMLLHAGLLISVMCSFPRRVLMILCFCSGLTLGAAGLLNVERFQPWMWQSILIPLLVGIQLLLSPSQGIENRRNEIFLQVAQWLMASIYFFSACSKLTMAYQEGIGKQFIRQLDNVMPLSEWLGSIIPQEYVHQMLILGIPMIELSIGLCMMWSRTRFAGYLCSVIMHVILLVILGPTGADQKYPVLVWNSFFIVQNTILYIWWSQQKIISEPAVEENIAPMSAAMPRFHFAVIIILCLPMLYWVNFYDAWLGWSLYSPSESIVHVVMPADEDLPGIQSLLKGTPQAAEVFLAHGMQQYCLDFNGAPMIPAEYYRMAIATWISGHLSEDTKFYVSLIRPQEMHLRIKNPHLPREYVFDSQEELKEYAAKTNWNMKVRVK